MTRQELIGIYSNYLDCLNAQDWSSLGRFVSADVEHNGRALGVQGYRRMLEDDFEAIPDLHFQAELLVADPPRIASRLRFDCSPKGKFFDLEVNGKAVSFTENVFYEFKGDKIARVWSVIDLAAIKAQLQADGKPDAGS
ncbi:ester cyclase [Marinobacter nanhaiticus D15-8W]|uniref:Ester cyclase n=1 Tax=Marinobacter nanhaiticus D15-8W TaxID=626887 RepID=N6WN25_9GAMM|nr:ester cyclase [Marinobacter nanhaiticus]ENO12901.1 ester cyclase [Marinobacter nanhaiticus D15-8W]BES70252.1 ester cyclase [Marinobacter nanhaiticus D15-8W]